METGSYKINRIVTILIIIGYIVVNISMQINFFSGNNIFDKYQVATSAKDAVQIAQKSPVSVVDIAQVVLAAQEH